MSKLTDREKMETVAKGEHCATDWGCRNCPIDASPNCGQGLSRADRARLWLAVDDAKRLRGALVELSDIVFVQDDEDDWIRLHDSARNARRVLAATAH